MGGGASSLSVVTRRLNLKQRPLSTHQRAWILKRCHSIQTISRLRVMRQTPVIHGCSSPFPFQQSRTTASPSEQSVQAQRRSTPHFQMLARDRIHNLPLISFPTGSSRSPIYLLRTKLPSPFPSSPGQSGLARHLSHKADKAMIVKRVAALISPRRVLSAPSRLLKNLFHSAVPQLHSHLSTKSPNLPPSPSPLHLTSAPYRTTSLSQPSTTNPIPFPLHLTVPAFTDRPSPLPTFQASIPPPILLEKQLRRTVLQFQKAGSLPLIESHNLDLAIWKPVLEAFGKGNMKIVVWTEVGERILNSDGLLRLPTIPHPGEWGYEGMDFGVERGV